MRQSIDLVNQPAADDVIEAIHAAMHAFRAQQYRLPREAAHDLTHMEGKALGYFARHPGATQSELAAHSRRDKGQLARLIKTLRERGLLDASADADDRRNLRLSLTPAGREVHQALHRQGRRLAGVAVAGLGADERAQLVALLQRLRENLDAAG